MSKGQIVLSNSYGTRNVGDEAILTVLIDELHDRNYDIRVLTLTPEDTAKRHPETDAVLSKVMRGATDTFNAIRDANALVVGGGGILQDATSLGNLLLHVSRPMMAAAASTPVAIAGVGIGPLQRRVSRTLTRWACNNAAHIDVRDSQSARLLAAIGINDSPVTVSADFAHLLPNHDEGQMGDEGCNMLVRLRETREQGRLLIGLSLRPAVGDAARRSQLSAADAAHLDVMAQAADALVEQHDAEIVFVSMHPRQDDPIADLLAERMLHEDRLLPLSGDLPPKTIKALVGELDLLIGTRLHALIFAACNQVPLVALAYDDKVRAYLESLGLGGQVVAPNHWQVDGITRAVQRTIDRASQICAKMEDRVPVLVEAASGSIDKICSVARGEC